MRKLSVQEIIEVVDLNDPNRKKTAGGSPITSSSDRQDRIKTNLSDSEREEKKIRSQTDANKPSDDKASILKSRASEGEERVKTQTAKTSTEIKKGKLLDARTGRLLRNRELDRTAAKVSSKEKLAQQIRGKSGYKPEKINNPKKFGVGGAARNLARAGTNLARNAAAISTNLSARQDRKELGKKQIALGRAPSDGTTGQKIRYAAGTATKGIRKPVAGALNRTADKIDPRGKRIKTAPPRKPFEQPRKPFSSVRTEDFIWEGEKKDQKKKEKIDVMKGTNKVEVNPKMQAEAKKMTKNQIKKRDKIADAISTREMNNRYGDKNVKYAIATKLAMKGKKKKVLKDDVTLQDANGNDFVQIVDLIKPEPLVKARSVQEISECWKTHKQVGYKKKGGRMVPNCVPKNEEVELGEMIGNPIERIRKTRQQKQRYGMTGQDMSDVKKVAKKTGGNIGAIKAKRKEQIGGAKIHNQRQLDKFIQDSKKNKVQNKSKTTSPYGSDFAINRKFNPKKGGVVLTNKFSKDTYPTKPYNEAKMPVQGLVKFDAMVAANKKKRKNALQIQKVIGEQTKEVDKKKLNKSLEKSLELTNYGSAEPFLSKDELKKRTEAKRKKRERIAKGDDRTTAQYNKDNLETAYQKTRLNQIFKTEGKGSNPNKRYIGPNVTSKKQFTQTGAIGIERTNPDEEQGIQQRRDAQKRAREEKRKRIEQNKKKKRQQRPSDVPSNPGSNKRAMRDAMRDIEADSDT